MSDKIAGLRAFTSMPMRPTLPDGRPLSFRHFVPPSSDL
jgi:hypothetical protein